VRYLPRGVSTLYTVHTMTRRQLEPVRGIAKAMGSCSTQAQAYGQCMLKHYQQMERDACAEEFRAFKDCMQKQVRGTAPAAFLTQLGRKW